MFRSVVNWFREFFNDSKGETMPAVKVESVAEEATRKGMSIAQVVLQRAGEKNVTPKKFVAPILMPGVVPNDTAFPDDLGNFGEYLALDDAAVMPAYAYANQFNCGLAFPGYGYLSELTQRSEYRAPTETIASEMTREWIKLVIKGKKRKKDKKQKIVTDAGLSEVQQKDDNNVPEVDTEMEDKLEQLEEAIEQFKIRGCLKKIAELDGFFGRGQLFIDQDVQGKNSDEIRQLPLIVDKATIKKGSIKGFKVVEPIWTTPYTYNATDPTVPDFYVPRAWFVLGKRTHASRLLTFVMREVPDILKPAYNFSGLSMTQLMEPYVFQWLRTRNSVSDLVHNFSVLILETDMSKVLAGDAGSGNSLLDRARLLVANRDNQGLTMVNKDEELLSVLNVPLGTLDKLQAQAQEHMAAPSHIPLVKLLGISPGGLNATSEGEIQVFYDYVRACQQQFFAPHLDTILQIIQLHVFGEIDDSIGFEFVSLSSPTVKELSEIRKTDADAAQLYVAMGSVSADEVRVKLRTDPESGYDGLQGEAPTPPTLEQEDDADSNNSQEVTT